MARKQPALFDYSPTNDDPADEGRHTAMLETALERARLDGYISELDEGMVSIARANARALDQAEADRKYYAVAQLSGPYAEVLAALKLSPAAREIDANDALTEALAELSTPTVGDTPA